MAAPRGGGEALYARRPASAGLADVTGDARFADAFFASHVEGSDLPDFAPLLARAGLTLRPARPGRGYLGAAQAAEEGGAVVLVGPPEPDTPLYAAGVERGDTLVSLGGSAITGAAGWQAALDALRPGDGVEIVFRQRGIERRATLVAIADPAVEIVRNEAAGQPLTPAQRAFRDAWLGATSSAASRCGRSTPITARHSSRNAGGDAEADADRRRRPCRRRSSGSR